MHAMVAALEREEGAEKVVAVYNKDYGTTNKNRLQHRK